jgi:hypothetical protein
MAVKIANAARIRVRVPETSDRRSRRFVRPGIAAGGSPASDCTLTWDAGRERMAPSSPIRAAGCRRSVTAVIVITAVVTTAVEITEVVVEC